MQVQSGWLAVSGGRLESRMLTPDAAGPDPARRMILMLHEGLGSVTMWKDFPDLVARETGVPVLVYSRFGYGASDTCRLPRQPDYMHDEAAVLAEIIAELDCQELIVLGHSDGASIAAIHASTHSDNRLRGIILMAPHFYTEQIALEAILQAKAAYDHGDLRQRLARYHGDNVDTAFRGWNDAWLNPAFHDWDIRPCLPGIKVPVLMIQGVEDEYGSKQQLDVMSELATTSITSTLLPNCRHSPHKDQSSATLLAIREFLAEN